DTAIANPRNLVSMVKGVRLGGTTIEQPSAAASPKRYGNKEVIDVLRFGNFSVTDCPAIRIAIDRNRNGKPEESDFQVGSTLEFYPRAHIPVLVEWISTSEFGPVSQIDVFVGNRSVTFAGKDHGAGVPTNRQLDGTYQPDPSGVLQIQQSQLL